MTKNKFYEPYKLENMKISFLKISHMPPFHSKEMISRIFQVINNLGSHIAPPIVAVRNKIPPSTKQTTKA